MKNEIFSFISYLNDIIANPAQIDYRIWIILALGIFTIFLLIFVIIWISKQPKREKIQINPVKDGGSSDGINQGRRFRFSENVADVYKEPTSKEELDFIVASHSLPEELNLIGNQKQQPSYGVVYPQLALYIKEARDFGMTDEMITQELKRVGWKELDIVRHLVG